MKPSYQVAADLLTSWREAILAGTPPTFFPVGTGALGRIEVGPGLVSLLGGAPGAGKTAFSMQATIDALRLTPTLKVAVCNVETAPVILLDRQLARLSGIPLRLIRYRQLGPAHADRIGRAFDTIVTFADRLAFVTPPFTLMNVAAVADDFGAGLLLLDYVQRILPPGQHNDRRGAVNEIMALLRQFADAGVAVFAVAALARTKDGTGRSSYAGDALNLASFRESSELEFGADDAFILVPDKQMADLVTLRHLKARHAEPHDIALRFDRPCQRFTPLHGVGQPNAGPQAGPDPAQA